MEKWLGYVSQKTDNREPNADHSDLYFLFRDSVFSNFSKVTMNCFL